MNSWNTTITGIVSIVAAVALAAMFMFDGDPETSIGGPTGLLIIGVIVNGAGNVMSRDNGRKSESVGAMP